jgi:hypothetical protein
MLRVASPRELLTVGPRLVGVPKVKSAFATLVAKTNANRQILRFVPLLIFCFLKFFSFYLLSFTSRFGLAGPTLLNGETGGTERFLLRFFSRIGKIYAKSFTCGG